MAALMQIEVLESTTEDDREEKKEGQKNVIITYQPLIRYL